MQIAVSEAEGLLLDLVRRAEDGEEIVITRRGVAIAWIVSIAPDVAERRSALEEARTAAAVKTWTTAARSHDFLYDDAGLPG